MKVEATPSDLGTSLVLGQQNIEVGIPRGGTLELQPATRKDGSLLPGHVRALVRAKNGAALRELTLDEREVPRPVSVEREL